MGDIDGTGSETCRKDRVRWLFLKDQKWTNARKGDGGKSTGKESGMIVVAKASVPRTAKGRRRRYTAVEVR